MKNAAPIQVTRISAVAMGILCQQNARKHTCAGYTVRPGFSTGLLLSNRVPPLSGYKGFRDA